jgi:hypothetical protein
METHARSLHAARLVSFPACIVLCSALVYSPAWFSRPEPVVQAPPAVVEAPKPEPKPLPKIPKIVAVNERIAKRVNSLRPCVKKRLARVAKKLPAKVTLLVTSAHRTRAEQAAIRPTFGIKAKPGTSTHEDGRAVDLNVIVDGERVSPRLNQKVIGKVMASEGFRHLGPRDPVHYSVPKWEINKSLADAPDLDVMTVSEMQDIQAEILAASEETSTVAYVEASASP